MYVYMLPQQWKHCTKLIQHFLVHFFIYAHPPKISTFTLLMSKKGLTGKGTIDHPFSFLLCHHFHYKWLAIKEK